jgi:DNA-directed RNA polymerase sigma subunit (sigma70/sigma32)
MSDDLVLSIVNGDKLHGRVVPVKGLSNIHFVNGSIPPDIRSLFETKAGKLLNNGTVHDWKLQSLYIIRQEAEGDKPGAVCVLYLVNSGDTGYVIRQMHGLTSDNELTNAFKVNKRAIGVKGKGFSLNPDGVDIPTETINQLSKTKKTQVVASSDWHILNTIGVTLKDYQTVLKGGKVFPEIKQKESKDNKEKIKSEKIIKTSKKEVVKFGDEKSENALAIKQASSTFLKYSIAPIEHEELVRLCLELQKNNPDGVIGTDGEKEWLASNKGKAWEKSAAGKNWTRNLDLIVRSHIKFVLKLVNEVLRGNPERFDDLMNEGLNGLKIAALKFSDTKGQNYLTYASWWIKQKIRRYKADTGRDIRIPIHQQNYLKRLWSVKAILTSELGRDATNADVSEELGIPLKSLNKAEARSQSITSLDDTVGEDGDIERANFVPDESADVEDELEKSGVKTLLEPFMVNPLKRKLDQKIVHQEAGLTKRDVAIIYCRFNEDAVDHFQKLGIEGCEENKRILSLEATAEAVYLLGRLDKNFYTSKEGKDKLTRERIRQIQEKSFTRIGRYLRRNAAGVVSLYGNKPERKPRSKRKNQKVL